MTRSRWSNRLGVVCAAAMLLVADPARAESSVQITEASTVRLSSTPMFSLVCSGYDARVCSDVSPFYRFKERVQHRVSMVATLNQRWGARLTLVSGAYAEKLTINPRAVIGILGAIPIHGSGTLGVEIYTAIGGQVRHRPCLDGYEREYFCGTLTAWSDYPNKTTAMKEYGIKLLYRF